MRSSSSRSLRAGFGRRDVTPELGRPTTSGVGVAVTEIWDRLEATALVLDGPSGTFVVVGADLCAFLDRADREIREAVARELGLPAGQVLVNASHTHSAPYLSTEAGARIAGYGLALIEEEYVRFVQRQVVAAAREAAERAVPARARFGRGRVERVASNRRPRLDGRVVHRYGRPPEDLRRLPEGRIDPDCAVLRFDDRHDRPLGAVVGYACHPTATGGDLHGWVSADFVGGGRRAVEAELRAPCLFLQGAAGNVGTGKWIEGTPREDNEAMGRRFAEGVFRALGALGPAVEAAPRFGRAEVEIDLDPLPPVADLERRLETAIREGDTGRIVEYAERCVMAERAAELRRAPVWVLAVGEIAMAALPAELFVELGLAVRRDSPFPATMVTAYSNNSLQYIPTAEAFDEGAYEVDGGWRHVARGEGERLARGAVELLRRVASGAA